MGQKRLGTTALRSALAIQMQTGLEILTIGGQHLDTCFRLVEVLLLGKARNGHVLHCPLQKQNIWP